MRFAGSHGSIHSRDLGRLSPPHVVLVLPSGDCGGAGRSQEVVVVVSHTAPETRWSVRNSGRKRTVVGGALMRKAIQL